MFLKVFRKILLSKSGADTCTINIHFRAEIETTMSYTELESGYQGLRQNRPGFYVGHDGNIVSFVSHFL